MKLKYILLATLWSIGTLYACDNKFDYPIPEGSFDDISSHPPVKVEVVKRDGQLKMLMNGNEFYVNGVAGNRFVERAGEFGANVFRTYGINELTKPTLDSAYRHGIYVNVGLFVKRERDGFDYNNEAKVAEQLEQMRKDVKRFKDHPALLMWTVGNEAESMHKNLKLWDAINDIAKMIHETDSNHPTSTALAGANPLNIQHIIERAPHIDILSLNSYAPNVPDVLSKVQQAGWVKPYMITEFGPRGTWQMEPEPTRILPWGALVEQTSTEKESDYLVCMRDHIKPNYSNGCIGSFVFIWGYQTHGEVLNWYGTFDKKGYSYGSVDAMVYCWSGSYPANRAPMIASRSDITMNGKVAEDKIYVNAGSANTAIVTASDPDGDALSYDWMIMEEGTADTDGSMPKGITGLITDNTKASISFKAPTKAAGYRLYVFVRDDANKKVASAVIPFKVN